MAANTSVSKVMNKIIVFFLFNFVLGLLQSWILILWKLDGWPPNISLMFFDGGIYFFSTSLCYSSLFALLMSPEKKLEYGTWTFSASMAWLIAVTACAVISYLKVMGQAKVPENPFEAHQLSQVACLLGASIYAFFVAAVTGTFRGEP